MQSIIREVAHERISRANRLERHLRVAEYFESESDPELAGIIASHYLDALEVAPDDQKPELRPRAIAALLGAADRADALQSHPQVVRLSLRGIELTDDPTERGELYLRAARSEHALLADSAEDHAKEALSAFAEADDSAGLLRAATTQARMLDDEGRSNEGWALLLEVVDDGDSAIHAEAYGELARAYMLDRSYEEALVWADRGLTIAERLDLIPIYTDTLITKGTSLASAYRGREAITLMEAGLDLAREHQLSKTKYRALNNLSVIGGSDRWNTPELLEEQLADARRIGEPRQLIDTKLSEAWTNIWNFDWDRVDEILADIDPETRAPGTGTTYNDVLFTKMALAGEPDEAERRFEAWWEESLGVGDAQQTGSLDNSRISNAFLCGRYEEAFEKAIATEFIITYRVDILWALLTALLLRDQDRLHRVLQRIEESLYRGRVIDLFRHAALGGVAELEGREAEAAEQWAAAVALADEVMPRGIAEWFRAAGAASLGADHPPGAEWANSAYVAFTEVGADTLLDLYADGVLAPDAVAEEAGSA